MEFAVRVDGEQTTTGFWVFAVDSVGERLLIATEDKRLRWVAMADCIVIKAANPEMPRPVIAIQPQTPLAILDPHKIRGNSGR